MADRISEVIRLYFQDENYEIKTVPFGLTNLTRIIELEGEKYVLRIYNPHTKNAESVSFEAGLTAFLSEQVLSFKVPLFIQSRERGRPFVELSDGTLGAMVSFIEGTVPELSTMQHAENFGSVLGELSSALSKYQPEDHTYVGIPFTNLYDLHPLANRLTVRDFLKQPPFPISPIMITNYNKAAEEVGKNIHVLASLPSQWVHHDVLIYNLLSRDGEIQGVLDYDFTSMDVGFMEFAISLIHIQQRTSGSWEMIENFVRGYSHWRNHSLDELRQLQLLTQVYHLAVLHIYIGQHQAGQEIEQNFLYILNQLISTNDWLDEHQTRLSQLLYAYLS
ncbi:phosphotransferase enzyme family protein [Paenibacillus sp. GCM10023252]|uniref:phosphotransferase enzyme family protein n=1 Tax=Paenibacillus sp. GCM10023252 TaxID=3252649 RepID=UPI00361B2D0B